MMMLASVHTYLSGSVFIDGPIVKTCRRFLVRKEV